MDELFERFLKEKLFLKNVSPRTIIYFKRCYSAYKRHLGVMPTEANLKEFVIKLRESGVTIETVNSYIRGINSFLAWLAENGHPKLKMKLMKEPKKVLKTFSDQQVIQLLAFKPKNDFEHRLYPLLCLIIDTGVRIEEALTLERSNVDFNNLLFKVRGKGDKERILPMSIELRNVLFKYLKRHDFELVFCTRYGGRVSYRNALRDFKNLCEKLGIEGVRTSWHTLRHGFAVSYVRHGGSLFHLQKMLGHATLQMTRRYCELSEDDLKLMHKKTSMLSRLK